MTSSTISGHPVLQGHLKFNWEEEHIQYRQCCLKVLVGVALAF